MTTRLETWLSELRAECSDYEIAAGLGNGDIGKPIWLAKQENSDHTKIWDSEKGNPYTDFESLNHEDENDD